jgi:transcription elongation factor Elf1
MKNIKSIIITLTITLLLGSLLPITPAKATTINSTNQNATLKCCEIAYSRLVDLRSDSNVLIPTQSANVDAYNTFIDSLEAQGMNWNDISDYLIQSKFGNSCTWYNYHNK